MYRRDRLTCCYCGKSALRKEIPFCALTLDHIKPHSRGGSDREDNLCTACIDCNKTKAAKTLAELGIQLNPKKKRKRSPLVRYERHVA